MNILDEIKKAKNPSIKRIGEHLATRCLSDKYLDEKMKATDSTLNDCYHYIEEQAKAKASGNCAMIEDLQVYEWAVHFFLESNSAQPQCNSVQPVKETPKPDSKEEQPNLFDLL